MLDNLRVAGVMKYNLQGAAEEVIFIMEATRKVIELILPSFVFHKDPLSLVIIRCE